MMTEPQRRTFIALESYIAVNGYAPTVMELRDLCGLASTGSVHRRLRCLELRGHIKIERGVTRGLTICRARQYAFFKWDDESKALVEMENPRRVRSDEGLGTCKSGRP
jgi:SOS-response transcriptional repressor LexA